MRPRPHRLLRWSFWRTLLCWVKAWVGLEESVELAGDVADQAASDLAVGLSLGAAPLGVGAGGWVVAQPGQDDQVQGLVELTIPGPVEPHAHRLAAGGRDGGGTAQHGEGSVAGAAARV
jgi:hypothetical protein